MGSDQRGTPIPYGAAGGLRHVADQETVRAHIWVTGRVQGVGYRAFAQRIGQQAGLQGGVRNLDDGRVEIEVEGPPRDIEAFVERMKTGPPSSRVQHVEIKWEPPTERVTDFRIWY